MLRRCMLVSCNQLLGQVSLNRVQVRVFLLTRSLSSLAPLLHLHVFTFSVVPLQLGSADPYGVPQHGTTLRVDNPESA